MEKMMNKRKVKREILFFFLQQKKGYGITERLVGSEKCIRKRSKWCLKWGM